MAHGIGTFNGSSRIITLVSGVISFDVQDLYSEWKEFAAVGSNLKFAPAFRTTGGDPLTAGIDAGAYFFLQNQASGVATGNWRIKPFEADATVIVAGNLVSEDSTFPIAIPTDGEFTVLLAGLQPITQNIDEILVDVQAVAFGRVVTIDTVAGTAGTSFPIGTPTSPVNNIVDARIIADSKNLREFNIRDTITLDQTYLNWAFTGVGGLAFINLDSQDVTGSVFVNCSMSGTSQGDNLITRNSDFFAVNNYQGQVFETLLVDSVSIGPSTLTNHFIDCRSGNLETDRAMIDMVGEGRSLGVQGYAGSLEIKNLSGPDDLISVDLLSGNIILDSTCISGTIVLRGVGTFTDNTMGSTIISSGLISTATTADAVWDQPTTDITSSGSIGEFITTKLLTVSKFLGLK